MKNKKLGVNIGSRLILQRPDVSPFHCAMDFDWLIIDGYNLLHQDDALDGHRNELQTARQRLVRRIERVALEMAPRITVVFDGRQGGRDAAFDAPHLEVLFSPANRTADAVIERMVAKSECPEKIGVVTSDRMEAQIVSAAGASVLSCVEFVSRCATFSSPIRRRPAPRASTLGDFFPKSGE